MSKALECLMREGAHHALCSSKNHKNFLTSERSMITYECLLRIIEFSNLFLKNSYQKELKNVKSYW